MMWKRYWPEMIIVYPNGLPDGMWVNSKDGRTPIETIVIQELIPHIDRMFRTQANRSGRVIEGHSMGGYGALRLGMKYPDLFSGLSAMGAGPLQRSLFEGSSFLAQAASRERVFARVFGNNQQFFEDQSPWNIAKAQKNKLRDRFTIRQIIGTDDDALDHNRQFHQHLLRLGIPHQYLELDGVGHNPWDTQISIQSQSRNFYWKLFPNQ
jgi:S-formylglutathione hydrolase FrmB